MRLMDYVVRLEGKSDEERKNIIINTLKSLHCDFSLEKYKTGENIIFEIGNGKQEILATTHYDVMTGSPGANDNASSISVILDVYRRLKKVKLNNKIRMIIFDDEEPVYDLRGCFGSRQYIKKHGLGNIIAVYNLELCGMGDVVGIWPVTKYNEDSFALSNLRETLKQLNIYSEEASNLPGFYGDHRSFIELGFKHAFCLTAALKEEKELIRKFVESSSIRLMTHYFLGKLFKSFQLKVPKLFQYYHTSEDKSKYLSESALKMMSDVLYHSIINLDKKKKKQ